jgi:hypothetical protein
MSTFFGSHKRSWHGLLCVVGVALAVLPVFATGQRNERIVLLPVLRSGQTFRYESHARIDRRVETKSSVSTILTPNQPRQDAEMTLRFLVKDAQLSAQRFVVSGDTTIEPASASSGESAEPKPQKVAFQIAADGSIAEPKGLDDLGPAELLLWQFWSSQFAFEWTLPVIGVKPGEKWKNEEVEKAPTPIANLVWERDITYVENDKCPLLAGQECAVFLISSTLKQKSNPKDATPEDYRIRQLKTSGTASGTNETVAYISLQTGLLVRATEDSRQFMSVTVAKADESNQVHYEIKVNSHFDTALAP